jgi:hypothetical protein
MDVAKLMGNDAADPVFADPPYNIDYEGYTELRLKIKGDRMSERISSAFWNLHFAPAAVPSNVTWCLSPCVPFLVEDRRKRHHASHGDGSQKFRDAMANMKRRLDKLERLMAPKFKEDFRVVFRCVVGTPILSPPHETDSAARGGCASRCTIAASYGRCRNDTVEGHDGCRYAGLNESAGRGYVLSDAAKSIELEDAEAPCPFGKAA